MSVRLESAEGVLELSADELIGLKKDHESLIKPKAINELFNNNADEEQKTFAEELVQKTHDQIRQLDAAVFLGHFADEINETISDKTNFEQSPETLDGLIEHLTSAELPVDRTMLVKLAIVFQSNVLLHHDMTDALVSTFGSEPVAGRFSIANITEEERTDTQSDILKSLISGALHLDDGASRLRALSVDLLAKGVVLSDAMREDIRHIAVIVIPDDHDDAVVLEAVGKLRHPSHPFSTDCKAVWHIIKSCQDLYFNKSELLVTKYV